MRHFQVFPEGRACARPPHSLLLQHAVWTAWSATVDGVEEGHALGKAERATM